MEEKKDNIYIYLWEEFSTIYIGRTINPKGRHYAHKHRESEKTYQFSAEHMVEHPKMIVIESNLSVEEGVGRERYWIEYYRNNSDYNVLNKTCGGQICGKISQITDEEKKRKRKEYNQAHKKERNEYYKNYRRERNKEKKLLKAQERVTKKILKAEKKIGKLIDKEKHYKEFRDNKLKKQKLYYEAHKEELKSKYRKYRETHKEVIKLKNKEYNEAHKEEIKNYQHKYYEKHKEQKKIYMRKYYSQKK